MSRNRLILTIALLSASLFSMTSRAEVNIVATIKPLQLIAEAVLQEHGSVTSIMDARQSPHHFTLSPSDRVALARADITMWIGPVFEVYLRDFFAQTKLKQKTITATEFTALLTLGAEQIVDAHLWLDTSNAVSIATEIANRVMLMDPDNAADYRQNLHQFKADIAALNLQLQQRFQAVPSRRYIVYHNAYQYFEKQFGLEHDMVILRDPEVQPGIRYLIQLRDRVREGRPSCLLLEYDSNKDLVATVLDGHKLEIIYVDLLAARVASKEKGYSQFVSNLADDFYRCLYQ